MNLAAVFSVVGLLSAGLGASMLAPMAVALAYDEPGWSAFLGGAFTSMVLGLSLFWLLRESATTELRHRDGMAIVGLGWLAAGLLGGLPLLLSGDFAGYTDAAFESISGLTTTGASILTNVEEAQKCVLFWRALTHWLGGMGFIVLGVAVLPFVGVGGMQLFKAEVPSPTPDKLGPRITDTASALWVVYAVLTGLEALLLLAGGMGWFDAVTHSFATMATGGFSTKNASVGHWDSAYIQWVVTLFMWLAGINFNLHFLLMRQRRWNAWWTNEEWRVYTAVFAGVGLAVALGLWLAQGLGPGRSLTLAFFQSATLLTTTGFATADYSLWPAACLAPLLVLLFVGGSAGSTGGGPKVMRLMIVVKNARNEFFRLIHPRAVTPVKIGRRTADKHVVASVWSFMGLYLGLFVLVGLVLAFLGVDVLTAFSASIACLGNIGPGLGQVGPAGNYAALPLAGKWVLAVAMVVGRLELYTILIMFIPEFWRD